ncbi:MAG: hypothetical protein SVN78_02690 [Deferribacterota bacterium]|nr:hypothetical protein [Deferribacterota bacterium]
MKGVIFILSLLLAFTCVTPLYSAIGNPSEVYKINIGDKAVYDEGVVNMGSKKLLKLITSEALDKSKTIVLFGGDKAFDLVNGVANLYGYSVEKSTTNSFVDGDKAPVNSFILKGLSAREQIGKSGVIKAIEEAEESGYKVEKVNSALDKLSEAILMGLFGKEQLEAISNEILANEDVQTFFGRVKDIINTQSGYNENLSSKNLQYSETLDLIAEPLGHYVIVPMLDLVNSVVTPLLPNGSMPAFATRLIMQVGFPLLDVVFNTFPVLRPIAMDLMAPIVSNTH